mgnify:CR=1 FL=1
MISAETLALHHGKHHKKYIDTLNELLGKTELHGPTLEDVVHETLLHAAPIVGAPGGPAGVTLTLPDAAPGALRLPIVGVS